MKKFLLIVTGVLIWFSSTAYSASVHYIPSVDGFDNISGADMAGMEITAKVGGVESVLTWGDLGGLKYGVSGTGWELSFSGENTFSSPWQVSGSSGAPLQSLTINALAVGVLFDIYFINNNSNSTSGSASGFWSETDKTANANSGVADLFKWTFSEEVALDGSSGPVGDLFGTLTLDFTSGNNNSSGLTSDTSFWLDTDIVATVPIPASIALLFFGILSLFGVKRNNR